MAVDLCCRYGQRWNSYAGLHYFAGETRQFCWKEIYLEPRFAPVLADVTVLRAALFVLVEAHTGERIEEIQQEIRPVQIMGQMALAWGGGMATGA